MLIPIILGFPFVKEIIVVDDSTQPFDLSVFSKSDRLRIFKNPRRLGLAPSILKGVLEAQGNYLLIRDSDWNHPVEDLPRLWEATRHGADLSIASRYFQGRPKVQRTNDLLSMFLNSLLRLRSGQISDWTHGYFLVRRSLLVDMPALWLFRGRGEYCVRLFRWLLQKNIQITELETKTQSRGAGKSTTSALRHGPPYLWAALSPSSFWKS